MFVVQGQLIYSMAVRSTIKSHSTSIMKNITKDFFLLCTDWLNIFAQEAQDLLRCSVKKLLSVPVKCRWQQMTTKCPRGWFTTCQQEQKCAPSPPPFITAQRWCFPGSLSHRTAQITPHSGDTRRHVWRADLKCTYFKIREINSNVFVPGKFKRSFHSVIKTFLKKASKQILN